MLNAYWIVDQRLRQPAEASLEDAVWIDLLAPDQAEVSAVEALCGIDIPTPEDMQEIEISSRLYQDEGVAFMTAMVVSHSETEEFVASPMTFILTRSRLITLRFHEPRFFSAFLGRAQKSPLTDGSAANLLVALLEAAIDRLADIIERTARDVDVLSADIFGQSAQARPGGPFYRDKLVRLGQKGDLMSNIRESLTTFDRLFGYLGLIAAERRMGSDLKARIKTLSRDARSISDHLDYVSQKVTFLLDATLGLINIEQNAIIKIFSVAAVVFLPPTLIASLYGMNFRFMPELHWTFGYPVAIAAMIVSAILPYLFFKRRGWL